MTVLSLKDHPGYRVGSVTAEPFYDRKSREGGTPARKRKMRSRMKAEITSEMVFDEIVAMNEKVVEFWNTNPDGAPYAGSLPHLRLSDAIEEVQIDAAFSIVAPLLSDGRQMKRLPGYASHAKTIRAARTVCEKLKEGVTPAVYSPTQSGKTAIIVMVSFFLRMLHMRAGENVLTYIMPPLKRAPDQQIRNANEQARIFYEFLQFVDTPGLTLGDANNLGRQPRIDTGLRRSTAQAAHDIQDDVEQFRDASGKRPRVVLIMDEADEATDRGGVFDCFRDALEEVSIDYTIVPVSATPHAFNCLKFNPVRVLYDEDDNYVGLFQGKHYPIVAISELAPSMERRGVSEDVVKELGYFSILENAHLPAKLEAIKQTILSCILGIDEAVGGNGKPFQGGRGMIVRYGAGATTVAFENYMRPFLKQHGVKLIPYYGSHLKDANGTPRPIEEAIKDVRGPYLLLVKDAGRRADQVPPDCGVFLEITEKYAYVQAAIQGFPGRITGFDKITDEVTPLLLVSETNATLLRKARIFHKETKIEHINLPYCRAVRRSDEKLEIQTREHMVIDIDHLHPSISEKIIANIEEYVIPYSRVLDITNRKNKRKNDKRFAYHYPKKLATPAMDEYVRRVQSLNDTGKLVPRWDYINLLGGEVNIWMIEGYLSKQLGIEVEIMRPAVPKKLARGETVREYATRDGRFVYVGFERCDTKQEGGVDETVRDSRRGDTALVGNRRRVRPAFRFYMDTNGNIRLKDFTVFFTHPVPDTGMMNPNAADTLPSPDCSWVRDATVEEAAISLSQYAKHKRHGAHTGND